MIEQIVELYEDEIRYLDTYYSSDSVIGYLEELVWLDREIEMKSGSHSMSEQKLVSSLVTWRESVIRRIKKCMFADISKEKEYLRACVNELEALRLGAVV